MTDYRLPEHRRNTFLDFWEFHLRYRSHPGCVYYLIPYLRDTLSWTKSETLWFAFINGNTQNPITSYLLHRISPTPDGADAMLAYFADNYSNLSFDTDRRHHKKNFKEATESYLAMTGDDHEQFWDDVAKGGFTAVWNAATSIYTFGRLSAFSYSEYLRIAGLDFDCDTLFLDDRSGSKSHRNGLCRVAGLEQFDWHDSNPTFNGNYPKELITALEGYAEGLLYEMKLRSKGADWEHDVSYFTMESALCTYKSWHRPNRRYPNVYNDMLYYRIKDAEKQHPTEDLTIFWEARKQYVPAHLRLEDNPTDPGLVPEKQNHYRETGQVIMMDTEYPQYANDFNDKLRAGGFPKRIK